MESITLPTAFPFSLNTQVYGRFKLLDGFDGLLDHGVVRVRVRTCVCICILHPCTHMCVDEGPSTWTVHPCMITPKSCHRCPCHSRFERNTQEELERKYVGLIQAYGQDLRVVQEVSERK